MASQQEIKQELQIVQSEELERIRRAYHIERKGLQGDRKGHPYYTRIGRPTVYSSGGACPRHAPLAPALGGTKEMRRGRRCSNA
jgi:hypothetical protein